MFQKVKAERVKCKKRLNIYINDISITWSTYKIVGKWAPPICYNSVVNITGKF